MGKVFLYKNGGGTSLHFAFKTYATQAELEADTPSKNNTIGLVTTTPVGDYQFTAIEPMARSVGTALQNGDLWIQTDNTSTTAFNALGKNSIVISPIRAYQYLNTKWVQLAAEIYQYESWYEIDPCKYVYKDGEQYFAMSRDYQHTSSDILTFMPNYINFYVSNSNALGVATTNKIAIPKRTLKAKFNCISQNSSGWYFVFVDSTKNKNPYSASYLLKSPNQAITGIQTVTVTIPASYVGNSYYVGFAIYHQSSLQLQKIWFE